MFYRLSFASKRTFAVFLSLLLVVCAIPAAPGAAYAEDALGSRAGVVSNSPASEVVAQEEEQVEAAYVVDSSEKNVNSADFIVGWTECGTCVWSIDSKGSLIIEPADDGESGDLFGRTPWSEFRNNISSIKLHGSIKGLKAEGAFQDMPKLRTADLTGLDASGISDMTKMFSDCSKLISVSGLDVTNARYLRCMFYGCSSLTSVGFDIGGTLKATDMNSMFRDCSSLTSIDLSAFDASSVTNVSCMFSGCSSLASIDLSGFDTSKVTSFSNMFSGCSSLVAMDLSGFCTHRAEDMSGMFSGCSSLASLDLSAFDTWGVTDMGGMFSGCSSLASLDLSAFDTSNVEAMNSMFRDCSSLTSIDLSAFDASSVTNVSCMFSGCSSLTLLDLSGFTASIGCSSYMFSGCTNLSLLDISNLRTVDAYDMFNMFSDCYSLERILLGENFSFHRSFGYRFSAALPEGLWKSSLDDRVYRSEDVPDLTAATYSRVVDISNASLRIDDQVYTGSILEPDVVVELDGVILAQGTDYSVAYQNNIAVGTAAVTVTGLGNYTGVASATFAIIEAPDPEPLPTPDPAPVTSLFIDVDSSVAHADDISWLAGKGVSAGWVDSDGTRTFRPYNDVARADMAAFLYRLAGSPEYTAPGISPFRDVDSSTAHYKEICWLADVGISQGWGTPDGREFRPYATVARCDMAAFLYRLAGSPSYSVSGSPFVDCSGETPHYTEVCWLAEKGISAGWSTLDGKEFRPYNTVARADMAAFLHRMKEGGLV